MENSMEYYKVDLIGGRVAGRGGGRGKAGQWPMVKQIEASSGILWHSRVTLGNENVLHIIIFFFFGQQLIFYDYYAGWGGILWHLQKFLKIYHS
jgi:hypothetical protein